MTKLEELENEVQSLYNKYYDLHNKKLKIKETIDGCLAKIGSSYNEKEVEKYYNILINKTILEYKNIAREAHKAWDEYFNLWIKWREKNE